MGKIRDAGRQPRPDAVRVVGIDFYNQAVTGGVSMTLASARSDPHHVPCVLIFDARGNGGGGISPTITGDHQNRVTDYTAVVVSYEESQFSSEHRPRMVDDRGDSGDAQSSWGGVTPRKRIL